MPEEQHPQNPVFIQRMFGQIAHRYDLANHILSMGLDYGWRRKIGRILAGTGATNILDLATGSGDLAKTLAHHCPHAKIIAADFCLPMLAQAQKKSVPNLVAGDGMKLPFASGTFDALTIAFGLRNMSSYPDALKEFIRVLKPQGQLLILDFSFPENFIKIPYRIYLRHVLPHIAKILTGEKCAYDYLGASIEAFPSGQKMIELLKATGAHSAVAKPLAGGIVTLYQAEKVN